MPTPYTVAIEAVEVVTARTAEAGATLTVLAAVTAEDGSDMTPPDLNPITIVNAPTLVPDPKGEVVAADGRRYTDAPVEAIRITVEQTVAIRLGY